MFLLFVIVLQFYTNNETKKDYKEKVTALEQLEKEQKEQMKTVESLEQQVEELTLEFATQQAGNVAILYKMLQLNVSYDDVKHHFEETDTFVLEFEKMKEKFGDYATDDALINLYTRGLMSYDQYAYNTKTNLLLKDITLELGNVQTDKKMSFDYYIDIIVDPIDDEPETVSAFGQLVVVNTDTGWKILDDVQKSSELANIQMERSIFAQ